MHAVFSLTPWYLTNLKRLLAASTAGFMNVLVSSIQTPTVTGPFALRCRNDAISLILRILWDEV